MNNLVDRCVSRIDPPSGDEAVTKWLGEQIKEDRPFLLAHADDGVIWGKWTDGRRWIAHEIARNTSSAGISPELRGITLQQAFVFGMEDEVRLFRDELGAWQARKIVDADLDDTMIEHQMLRGDEVRLVLAHGFTHIRDRKQQGLDQIIPAAIVQQDFERGRRPRLRVHHFLDYDADSGEARIALSRLVDIVVCSDKEVAQ
ncbi:MAG: CRISPR-associated protein Csx19 [Anaerolineae bacterium]